MIRRPPRFTLSDTLFPDSPLLRSRVDLGGGLGVPYRQGDVMPSPAEYGAMVARATRGWDVELIFEPGRVIAGNAGVLLTRVIWVKPGVVHPYVIVDAAMNDLARPALYAASAEERREGEECVMTVRDRW